MYKVLSVVAFGIGVPAALVSSFLLLSTVSRLPAAPRAATGRVLSATTAFFEPLPATIPILSTTVLGSDARAIIVKNYLVKYKSPLAPHASDIVVVSDQYGVDPNLIVAIAQQESNLCKKVPTDSYNCWGFGIYADKVTRFESYPHAYTTVIKWLKREYLDKGLVTPEQIMAKYTPPSVDKGGAWAKGIRQFLAELE